MNRLRSVDAARLILGVVTLARPHTAFGLTRTPDTPAARTVVRVLGARYVVQSVGGAWVHRSWVPETDAAVDVVHAASMLALAAFAPRHRRLALASAAAAVGFATADLVDRRNP
ncbi:MAG: hypothetical protein ACR2K3_11310 [Nocardioides sp.]